MMKIPMVQILLTVCLLGPVAAEEKGADSVSTAKITVYVTGGVKKPGKYEMSASDNLLHAVADAGGIDSDFVRHLLLIRGGETNRIKMSAIAVRPPTLQNGDVISAKEGCVAAGSELLTREGSRLIEEIRVGDEVLGYSTASESLAFGRVVEVRKLSSELLFLVNQRLALTQEHPVWTQDGWEETKLLRPGYHMIRTPEGQEAVTSVSRIEDARDVFDITVEPTSCFFADGILVHNKW